ASDACVTSEVLLVSLSTRRPHPISTLFPYTTLFRSHAVLEHHRAGQLGRLLEVVRGTVRDAAEDDLLGGAAGKEDGHHVDELLRSEEHTSELQSRENLVCRLLLEKKKKKNKASPACP